MLVDVPRDVQEAEIDFEYPDEVDLPGWRPAARVNVEAGARGGRGDRRCAAAGAVRRRRRRSTRDACGELRRLAELWQLPVVTTLMAKGAFPETHELHFGWPGMHGPKWSNWAMNKCDVLVAVGARFDDRVTGKLAAFAPGATVVHLDVDAAEIGKLRSADVPVVGPLKQILAELATRARDAARRRAGLEDRRLARPARRTGARSSRSATASGEHSEAAARPRGAAAADRPAATT